MSPELDKSAQAIPEGAIRLPDVIIGGKTPQELEGQLDSYLSTWDARDLLSRLTMLPNQQTISLVKIKVADLGLIGKPTTDQVYARANELGLDLCPAEVGLRLWRLCKYQLSLPSIIRPTFELNELLHVGMKQIDGTDANQGIFTVERISIGPWLDVSWSGPDAPWHPEHKLVFVPRK
jgi:hypothetical protein